MPLALDSTLALSGGVAIPRLGLGVFRAAAGGEARAAVRSALELGYRHVDTAAAYRNEEDVGAALRDSGLPREAVFVTTKLWNQDQGYDEALAAFAASLERLGLDYVDLYLIHWPAPETRRASWRALERLLADGRCRAIGVSNYEPRHLDELADAVVAPAINQVELSPFLGQRALREHCRERGIAIAAYSPLTRGKRLAHPVVTRIAREAGKTAAQVLLRWNLQHGHVVLPKSARPERIAENADLFDFELSEAQMLALDALDEGLRVAWDPSGVP